MRGWHLLESPGSYVWGEVPEPVAGPREVVVGVVTSALNHIDHWMTIGRPRPKQMPHVSGADGAGIVETVGPEVTEWRPGDEVCIAPAIVSEAAARSRGVDAVLDPSMQILGEHRWGTHAERVVVPALALVRRPPTRSWADCAAYPTTCLTAYRMLRRARLHGGEKLLVTGAGGGVATALVHIGRAMGATVFATSRDAATRRRAVEMGAEAAFDSSASFPVEVDVVADSIGTAVWDQAVAALVPGGRLVTCGGTSGSRVDLDLPRLFFRQHEIIGSTMGSYEEFEAVTALVGEGMELTVDDVIPLDGYPEAVARIRTSSRAGKVVVDHRLESSLP